MPRVNTSNNMSKANQQKGMQDYQGFENEDGVHQKVPQNSYQYNPQMMAMDPAMMPNSGYYHIPQPNVMPAYNMGYGPIPGYIPQPMHPQYPLPSPSMP